MGLSFVYFIKGESLLLREIEVLGVIFDAPTIDVFGLADPARFFGSLAFKFFWLDGLNIADYEIVWIDWA